MKYALVFWWISLAGIPDTTVISNVGPKGSETVVGGVHQESVRLFATAEECAAAQAEEGEKHKEDVKLISSCSPAGDVFTFYGIAK